MGRLHWIGLGAGGLMLALAGASPGAAQSLSDGDYDRCAVYRGGDFRGYDSVCLERRRAALRHYRNDDGYGRGWRGGFDTDRYTGVYFCPPQANYGRGYARLNGYGTVDSPINGRSCTPRDMSYRGTGYY